MLKDVFEWIEHHFWVFMFIGLGIGFGVPEQAKILQPWVLPALGAVLLLTYLKLNLADLFSLGGKLSGLLIVVGVRFLAVPLLVLLFLPHVLPEYVLGIALLIAVPSALSSPVLADIFKGDIAPALFLAIVSHLISPLSIPLVLALAGPSVDIPLVVIGKMLLLLVGLPFIIAQLVRWRVPALVEKASPGFSAISLMLLIVVAAGTIAPHAKTIISMAPTVPFLLMVLFVVFLLLHLLGVMLAVRSPPKEKVSIILASTYMNLSLALVIASEFFGSTEVLVIVFFIPFWNLGIILFGFLMRRWLRGLK